MVNLLAYPLRVGTDGKFVTIEDGPDYYPQELVMLVKTDPGERTLVPTYGIADPTFNRFNEVELQDKVSTYGPPVIVNKVTSHVPAEGRLTVDIEWNELPIGETPDSYGFGFPTGTDNFIGDEDLQDENDYLSQEVYDYNDATD